MKWLLLHGNASAAWKPPTTCHRPRRRRRAGESSWATTSARRSASSAGYLAADASAGIPDYGERRRAGDTISTSFVESADNLVISKRPKRSSRCDGAPAVCRSYSRSLPGSSTTPSSRTAGAATPVSPTPTDRTRPGGSLPRVVSLCGLSPSDRHRGGLGPSEVDRGLGGHHLLGSRSSRWNPPAGVGPVVRVPPSSSARS